MRSFVRFFSAIVLVAVSQATECEEGFFLPDGAQECSACRTECPARTFIERSCTNVTDNMCTACQAGFACRGGSSNPILCLAGTYSLAEAEACLPWSDCSLGTVVGQAPTAMSNRVCMPCSAGLTSQRLNADSCEPSVQGPLDATVVVVMNFPTRELSEWGQEQDIALMNSIATNLDIRYSQVSIRSKFSGSVIITLEADFEADSEARRALQKFLDPNFPSLLPDELGEVQVVSTSTELQESSSGSSSSIDTTVVAIIAAVVIVTLVATLIIAVVISSARSSRRTQAAWAEYVKVHKQQRDSAYPPPQSMIIRTDRDNPIYHSDTGSEATELPSRRSSEPERAMVDTSFFTVISDTPTAESGEFAMDDHRVNYLDVTDTQSQS